jgi:hypothetical protein
VECDSDQQLAAQGSPGSNIQKLQNNPIVNKDRSTPVDHMKMGSGPENKSKVDESKLEKSGDSSDKIDRQWIIGHHMHMII